MSKIYVLLIKKYSHRIFLSYFLEKITYFPIDIFCKRQWPLDNDFSCSALMPTIIDRVIRLAVVGVNSLDALRRSSCELYEIVFLFEEDSWALSTPLLRPFCTCLAWTNSTLETYKFRQALYFCPFQVFSHIPSY